MLSSTWEGKGVKKIKDWVSKGNHCRSCPHIDTSSKTKIKNKSQLITLNIKIRHFDL